MVAIESCEYGEPEKCSPKVVFPLSEAWVHFMLTVPCSSREEGVQMPAGVRNELGDGLFESCMHGEEDSHSPEVQILFS